jgi:hypothetical protein
MSDASAANAGAAEGRERVRQQVEEALELANYIVETGVKGPVDQPIAFADIGAVQEMAARLGIVDVAGGGAAAAPPSSADWRSFAEAYYRLAIATSPVTAETLRNTAAPPEWRDISALAWITELLLGDAPAQRFTRGLLWVTIAFAVFVVVAEWQINVLGMEKGAEFQIRKDLWQSLLPWSYGGLGACAYLLRSAHTYIHQRCFDVRRKPEYTNRILLGAISGGAIILFSNYLASEDATVTHFGSAALGSIAGYSTDFLFNTIERIVTAIFPKVQIETVDTDASPTPRRTQRQPSASGDAAARSADASAADASVGR